MQVPVGTIISYAGTEDSLNQLLSTGNWLLCDGASYSTQKYVDLFNAISYSFGGNQSQSLFHVPDLRGMFLRGVNGQAQNDPDADTRTAQVNADGTSNGNTGNMVGSWQVDAVANHQHDWDHFFYWFNFRGEDIACHQPSDSSNLQNNTKQATNNDGGVKTGSQGKETRPKNVYVYYLISCVN